MPDGTLYEAIYMQRADNYEDLQKFFEDDQDWNLAPHTLSASDLRNINEMGHHTKPVFVEGDDGVVYAGTANGHPHYGGRERPPAILLRFLIGKNQETDSLDKKMRVLGFSDQGGRPIREE